MRRNIFLLLVCILTLLDAGAQEVYFGYTPLTEDAEHLVGIGTGKSTILDAAICLDATTDPVVARLEGQKIVGVRIFVRSAYTTSQQASNRFVFCSQGDADTYVQKKQCKFAEGWNEVMFTEPVEIGKEKLYVGARVYETFGTPYPFCGYNGAITPNGYYVRAGGTSATWVTQNTSSSLLIQAILEKNDALTAADGPLSASAHVSYSDTPLSVNPNALMSGSLYIHNQSAQPLEKLDFKTTDNYGVSHSYSIDLSDSPIPAYDGRCMSYEVYSPSQEGTGQSLTFSVSDRSISFTGTYYVMNDAFERVPIVEEFTSQRCVNCPMMAYYLDYAIENWHKAGKPLVYVTHHTGFAKDSFTQPNDEDLLYLFGSTSDTFNPAVMYDRRVFDDDNTPIHSAKVAEVSVYTQCIETVNSLPSLAKVDVKLSDDHKKVTVSGQVNNNFAKENIPTYLNCYLIENGISTSLYPQEGLDTEGAPADLAERFKHNGVVRHCFTNSGLGEPVSIETVGDKSTFCVEYDYPETLSPLPILDYSNTDIVAFLHLVDKSEMHNNYILNAGSLSLSGGSITGIDQIYSESGVHSVSSFNLSGQKVSPNYHGIVIQNRRLQLKHPFQYLQ